MGNAESHRRTTVQTFDRTTLEGPAVFTGLPPKLPTDKMGRKTHPITTGVLDYFPLAIAAVANVSYVGNQQHNPGQPMHWARHKSADHADCINRHMLERGTLDTDKLRHSAKVAWRALAMLELEIEADTAKQPHVVGGCATCAQPETSWGALTGSGNPEVGNYAAGFEEEEALKPAVPLTETEFREIFPGRVTYAERSIYGGIEFKTETKRRVYVSGPMRGLPKFNFPAFDEAAEMFYDRGYDVKNPADADRLKDQKGVEYPASYYADRDYAAIRRCTHIAMLPGWEKSTGAAAEFFLARWLQLTVLDATTGRLLREQSNWTHLIEAAQKFLLEQK